MNHELCPCLILDAESIHTTTALGGYGDNVLVTMFRPTPETVKRIQEMDHGKVFNGLQLRDRFDDGTTDTKISHQPHTYISTGVPIKNKTHTYSVVFKRG